MSTVVVFLGEGVYSGRSAYSFSPPQPGSRHQFMLFLRQEGPDPAWQTAASEADQFGFEQVAFKRAGSLDAESLNSTPGFAKHYEEALGNGSSLAWYPNAAPTT